MKILHLGDLHLGKSVCDFNMIEDQKYMLEQVLRTAGEQKADAVLIAGDVYDKSVPSEEAVRLLDWFLRRLSETGMETFLISGNHDSEERLHFGSSLFETNRIHISAKYDGTIYKKECRDQFGIVNVYLLPFIRASQVRFFYPEESIASYEDAVRAALSHADIDPSQRNILVAHQFVAGRNEDPVLGGSEGASAVHVGAVEKIGCDCFDAFDYVALGHIHSPQRVGRDTVRYAGSLLKYSLSEAESVKSFPLVTLEAKGQVTVSLIRQRPLRDMRHLRGKMRQLLDPQNIISPDDYIYVTLTDEEPADNAMGIFRQYYKNTMKIVIDNAHTREADFPDPVNSTCEKSCTELISDFYRMMYGCEISEEELRMIEEVAREAGVSNETD